MAGWDLFLHRIFSSGYLFAYIYIYICVNVYICIKFELHVGQRAITITNQSVKKEKKFKGFSDSHPLILQTQKIYRTPDFMNCL